MSELPAKSRAPRTRAADGDSDVPPAEVGRRQPAPAQPEGARGAPVAEPGGEEVPESPPRPRPRLRNGPGLAAFPGPQREPEGDGPEVGPAQPLFGEEVLDAHGGRLRGFDEPNWVFMDMCRAREVAHDASWQMRYPNVYLDYFTFIEDLFASVALSRLAAELGCDRLKDTD
ncbi:EP300-interacting inhibitor of differentiation 2-like [Choloepus didactylus]|uniref:EP300-interacting inhibitor of differentiation 2-like n=1 Tax=Choloepus didactylus TaxID=27675 RepID=UPI0018A0E3C9|nr:EP300-interacting inhibitor of differentiation 2-like [Choloepus didactylus]